MISPMEHTITLSRSAGGFAVTVEPMPSGFDFDVTDRPEGYARTYARSLVRHHGWTFVDLTGEAAHG